MKKIQTVYQQLFIRLKYYYLSTERCTVSYSKCNYLYNLIKSTNNSVQKINSMKH